MPLVKLEQPRFVNAAHPHGSGPNVVGTHHHVKGQPGCGVQFEFLGQRCANQHLLRTALRRQLTSEKTCGDAGDLGGGIQSADDDALQCLGGFHHARPLVAQGDVGHIFDLTEGVEHARAPGESPCTGVARRDLDVAVEADHQTFDFMLEALHHRRGQNHQGHTQGDA